LSRLLHKLPSHRGAKRSGAATVPSPSGHVSAICENFSKQGDHLGLWDFIWMLGVNAGRSSQKAIPKGCLKEREEVDTNQKWKLLSWGGRKGFELSEK